MNENKPSVMPVIIVLLVALILLWAGGWRLVMGEVIWSKQDLFIGHGVAIRFNNLYYGLLFDSRLFDSPIVSWVLGFLAACFIAAAMSGVETPNNQQGEIAQNNPKE